MAYSIILTESFKGDFVATIDYRIEGETIYLLRLFHQTQDYERLV